RGAAPKAPDAANADTSWTGCRAGPEPASGGGLDRRPVLRSLRAGLGPGLRGAGPHDPEGAVRAAAPAGPADRKGRGSVPARAGGDPAGHPAASGGRGKLGRVRPRVVAATADGRPARRHARDFFHARDGAHLLLAEVRAEPAAPP